MAANEQDSWVQRLQNFCAKNAIEQPQFQDFSDRRGGRIAWASSVNVQGREYTARFWRDYLYLEQSREEAAEIAYEALTSIPAATATGHYSYKGKSTASGQQPASDQTLWKSYGPQQAKLSPLSGPPDAIPRQEQDNFEQEGKDGRQEHESFQKSPSGGYAIQDETPLFRPESHVSPENKVPEVGVGGDGDDDNESVSLEASSEDMTSKQKEQETPRPPAPPDSDSDAISDNDSVFSMADSISTVSSLDSRELNTHVLQELASLLWDDLSIKRLCLEALDSKDIGGDRFERNFRRLLKEFAFELRTEARSLDQHRAAKFVALRSRIVASIVRHRAEDKINARGDDTPNAKNAQARSDGDLNENWSSSENEYNAEEDEPLDQDDLSEAKLFITSSAAFSTFRQSLQNFVAPTFGFKLQGLYHRIEKNLTGAEKLSWERVGWVLVKELRNIPLRDIAIINEEQERLLNSIKWKIECLTAESWDWWPLRPCSAPLGEGQARIRWICICGNERYANVPQNFADGLKKLIGQFSSATSGVTKTSEPSASFSQSQQNQSAGQAPNQTQGQTHAQIQVPTQHRNSASARSQSLYQSPGQDPNLVASQAQVPAHGETQSGTSSSSAPQNTNTSQRPTLPGNPIGVECPVSTRVMLIVRSRDDFYLAQLKMHSTTTTVEFFRMLRLEYFKLRGFLSRYFSVWGYSHCDFYKFEKFDELAFAPRRKNEYPPAGNGYEFDPKALLEMPPISEHEFKKHFYPCTYSRLPHLRCYRNCKCIRLQNKTHSRDVIGLLPKRTLPLDERSEERETFWGLYARQEIHFYRVVLYNMVCIGPFLWFCFMWVFVWGQNGDFQNASVPLMAMLALLSLFWSSFLSCLKFGKDA